MRSSIVCEAGPPGPLASSSCCGAPGHPRSSLAALVVAPAAGSGFGISGRPAPRPELSLRRRRPASRIMGQPGAASVDPRYFLGRGGRC
eukprot:2469236-Lingulodinium_polyedra.AAC.1